MGNGWIKLHRELLNKAIWKTSTPEQKTILITLLMMANHKDKEWEWKGHKYKTNPGQFVTSLKSIQQNSGVGVSIQNIRTALKRFEKYEFLTSQSTNKNRLITITNWELYQGENENQQANQQAPNKQLTTNKNDKNVRSNIYSPVVDYLNKKTGKSFRSTSVKTKDLINARLNEGFKEKDFYKVIDIKVAEWKGNPKMELYLRPETLFSNKFEGYLNQNPVIEDELAEIRRIMGGD